MKKLVGVVHSDMLRKIRTAECSTSLCATDCKGYRNQAVTGVVEIEQEEVGLKIKQLGNFSDSRRKNPNRGRVYDSNGIVPCINTMEGGGREPHIVEENKPVNKYRIRKLTPKECFRLQGWSDEYFSRAELVNSNSQLYKQAGNGVTVDVIYNIVKEWSLK